MKRLGLWPAGHAKRAVNFIVFAFAFAQMAALADDHYVATNGAANSPYTSWADAATNINNAIDASTAGDTILVSNGVYNTGVTSGRRVYISKAITVRSANNDPTNTIIVGDIASVVACVYMANNSYLIGFTLTNGAAASVGGYGGGVFCTYGSTSPIISNCVITCNSAWDGGGVAFCTLYNCTVLSNEASYFGGGTYGSILYNCTVANNVQRNSGTGGGCQGGTASNCTISGNCSANSGGGANGATLYNCTIIGNSGYGGGGASGCTLSNCTIIGNAGGGGSGGGASACTLYNCTLISNTCLNTQGHGAGAADSTLYNCLVAGNYIWSGSGGRDGGGTYGGKLYNCTVVGNKAASVSQGGGVAGASICVNSIVYFNTVASGGTSNWVSSVVFSNSCTSSNQPGWAAGNITSNPGFIANGSGSGTDLVPGNYRLGQGSSCINAGANTFVTTNMPADLDGNGRIDTFNQTVDMGCYEYYPIGLTFSVE